MFVHDAYYFQFRHNNVEHEEVREVSKKLGQELFSSGKVIESLKISAKILGTFVDLQGTEGYSKGFIVYVVLALMAITISVILMKTLGSQKEV